MENKNLNQSKKRIISDDELLASGVYFGHKKAQLNPKMKPFIIAYKNDTHIINIKKTLESLNFAYKIIKKFAEKGAKFVFVGTKPQAKETIKENALRTNSFYVDERWLGGTLTNSKTIFKRVKYMEELERKATNNFENHTKKEGVLFSKELKKLAKNLNGIRKMFIKPQIMIIASAKKDLIAIKEAKKIGVIVIGIADTNVDPSLFDIAIPANDDSVKSIKTIITILADAIAEAKDQEQILAFQNKQPNLEIQKNKRNEMQKNFHFKKEYQDKRRGNYDKRTN